MLSTSNGYHVNDNSISSSGTGYYLIQTDFPPDSTLTLIDMEPKPLQFTSSQVRKFRPRIEIVDSIQQDILSDEPLPKSLNFDSISLIYLLHCLPGPIAYKLRIFPVLKRYLKADGVLFGSTILGKGIKHNIVGRLLMWINNNITGVFDNMSDGKEEIENILRANFNHVECRIEGTVLLFRAQHPRHNI